MFNDLLQTKFRERLHTPLSQLAVKHAHVALGPEDRWPPAPHRPWSLDWMQAERERRGFCFSWGRYITLEVQAQDADCEDADVPSVRIKFRS